jgi:pimeloyl-ACP methyl ester carboxylesterase
MVKVPTVEEAFEAVSRTNASDAELLRAADTLVSWGYVDLADRVIERLNGNPAYSGQIGRLSAAARQLRRSGVLDELKAFTEEGNQIDGQHEAFTAKCATPTNKLIIVFTGIDPRFWLSLMLLHLFLRRLNTHIIYLTDLRQLIFFDGLESVAPTYDGLLTALKGAASSLGATEIHVMGNSAGGFAALRFARDLGAKTFLGTSIRTDLSESTSLPVSDFFKRPILREVAPQMLVDLKPLLLASSAPERIMLFCGEDNPVDLPHTLHLADLPNVEIALLRNYPAHDVISGLLGNGQFESVLQRFIKPGPIDKKITHL